MTVAEQVRPTLDWVDEDAARVLVHEHHIADLFWNGGEWFFIPYGTDGHQLTTEHWSYIKVDTERWIKLRDKANDMAAAAVNRTEAERQAYSKELQLERKEFRDDTVEFAEMAAIGKGRVWWKKYSENL